MVIREALAAVARNESVGGLISRTPVARGVVKRVVGGESTSTALAVAAALVDQGFSVSLERAAPSVDSAEAAEEVLAEYVQLVDAVVEAGLSQVCEVTVFPESLGWFPDGDGSGDGAYERLFALASHSTGRAVSVMVGMGPAHDADRTVEGVADLLRAGLDVGLTLPAVLRRSEADCERFGDSRVRLVKGGHRADFALAHSQPIEVDKAYLRCARTLLRGKGDPSFATHDPRLLAILESLTVRYERPQHTFEYAFFMGRQEAIQRRLLASGERVRVYVPYGPDWFERLVGGLAEQPSSIVAAVRSLLPGSP